MEEEVRAPGFASLLRGYYQTAHPQGIQKAKIVQIWSRLTDGEAHSDRDAITSRIWDPIYRFIHKIMAHTIVARFSGADKCNRIDLFCLYCMIQGHEANIATMLLSAIQRGVGQGRDTRLTLGPYIGRLAGRLGVYDRYPRRHLTMDFETIGYRIHDMRQPVCVSLMTRRGGWL